MPGVPPASSTIPAFLGLMRHAAAAPAAGVSTDFARPLTRLGRRRAAEVGAWLRSTGLVPRQILSSSAARALESAGLVAAALQLGADRLRSSDALYTARPADMLREIRAAAGDRLLVIGHNPTIQLLLEELCEQPPRPDAEGKIMRPAAVAVLTGTALETTEDWTGKLTLRKFFHPPGSTPLEEPVAHTQPR